MCCLFPQCLGYPNEKAVHIALGTVRDWLEDLKKSDKVNWTDDMTICTHMGGSVAEWLAYWTQAQKGPWFKSQSRCCPVTVLGKLFTPIVPVFTKQQNW